MAWYGLSFIAVPAFAFGCLCNEGCIVLADLVQLFHLFAVRSTEQALIVLASFFRCVCCLEEFLRDGGGDQDRRAFAHGQCGRVVLPIMKEMRSPVS